MDGLYPSSYPMPKSSTVVGIPVLGDLAIQDGRIAQIALPGTLHGERTIDVQGRYITPGFIDIHTHSDLAILINRPAESAVARGYDQIVGNCGMSPAPVYEAHFADIRSYWGDEAEMPGVTWGWRDFAVT